MNLTHEYLIERLDYNPTTGAFVWKARQVRHQQDKSWNVRYAGKQTGYLRHNGYRVINLDKVEYPCSRLAWFYVHGQWPQGEIDHINLQKADNRIANLRESTRSENASNKPKQANNTTGFKGVWKRKHLNRWVADIMKNGKKIRIGSFGSPEEAHQAYSKAAIELHGEFAKV